MHLYVPKAYGGDWEHFVGVATHLYLNADPAFLTLKAKQLAEEAVKPDSKLEDISYAWEAIGPAAVPFITPLLSSPQQDVQFASLTCRAFVPQAWLKEVKRPTDRPSSLAVRMTLGVGHSRASKWAVPG